MSQSEKLQFRGKTLLIIDDDPEQLRTFREAMRRKGFEVITWLMDDELAERDPSGCDAVIHSPEEFSRRAAGTAFDALLSDGSMMQLPRLHWPEALAKVEEAKPGIPKIVHSGKYNDFRECGHDDVASRFFAEDTERVNAAGGVGLFDKGSYDEIAAAFAAAFVVKAKRVG